MFRKYDKDNSGSIDMSELRSLVYDMGHPLTDDEFERAKQLLDANGDGVLSYAEFKEWWSKHDRFEMLQKSEAVDENYTVWMEGTVEHFKFFDKCAAGSLPRLPRRWADPRAQGPQRLDRPRGVQGAAQEPRHAWIPDRLTR